MAWYGQTFWLERWEGSWGDAPVLCAAIYSPVQRNLALWLSVKRRRLFREHWLNHREAGCPSDHFGKASAPRLNDIVSAEWPDGLKLDSTHARTLPTTALSTARPLKGTVQMLKLIFQPSLDWHPYLAANACHPLPGLGAWAKMVCGCAEATRVCPQSQRAGKDSLDQWCVWTLVQAGRLFASRKVAASSFCSSIC